MAVAEEALALEGIPDVDGAAGSTTLASSLFISGVTGIFRRAALAWEDMYAVSRNIMVAMRPNRQHEQQRLDCL
jgi:hypothetical protein